MKRKEGEYHTLRQNVRPTEKNTTTNSSQTLTHARGVSYALPKCTLK